MLETDTLPIAALERLQKNSGVMRLFVTLALILWPRVTLTIEAHKKTPQEQHAQRYREAQRAAGFETEAPRPAATNMREAANVAPPPPPVDVVDLGMQQRGAEAPPVLVFG